MILEVLGANMEVHSTFFPNFLQENQSEEIGFIVFFFLFEIGNGKQKGAEVIEKWQRWELQQHRSPPGQTSNAIKELQD